MMTEIRKRDLDRLMNPRSIDDILWRYRKEDTAMSDDQIKLAEAVAREREARDLLGEVEVGIIRVIWPGKSLADALIDNHGSFAALRELRRSQQIQLSRRRSDRDERRRAARASVEEAGGGGVTDAEFNREFDRLDREEGV